MPHNYEVKNIELFSQGLRNLQLAESNMGALMEVRRRFKKEKPFKDIRIGIALHVTKETGVLIRTLQDGGAKIVVTSCNPLSTQDDVAAALAKEGVAVYAFKGESETQYYRFLNKVIESRPQITIDDGCDLISEIHKNHRDLIPSIIGGCEETTTGILRLKSMERDSALKYPIIAVNDNKTKHLMDNYYGTGQSTIDGIIRATNVLFCGKTVIIAGYGSCGKGCALRAKGLGSKVIVTEVDNFAALQAAMDGFNVMKMEDAAKIGDIFITVTGCRDVLTLNHINLMKNGAILANSGHFDVEIDVRGMKKKAKHIRKIRDFMDEYTFEKDKKIYILGEGRLINLAAAEGHPSEVMSLSFCGQALACEYLIKHRNHLSSKVHVLPKEIDDYIAKLQLKTMGLSIDELSPKQIKYLNSWSEGT